MCARLLGALFQATDTGFIGNHCLGVRFDRCAQFSVKLARESRATRDMQYLWTGEVVADGHGFRVLGTGSPGMFVVPASIAEIFPAVLSVHLTALNANGKAYQTDRVYQLNK